MRETSPAKRRHSHEYDSTNPGAERRTRQVVVLTAVMMVVEIGGGWLLHSMALLADGWHMSSHTVALGLSAAAYALARRLSADRRFAFGTWKIEVLGGYTSALFLVGVALYMAFESIARLFAPATIHFNEAIVIAVLGLAVNLISAWLLRGAEHGHAHAHGHTPDHRPHHAHPHEQAARQPSELVHEHAHHLDLNLRSAYVHVAADAATSVLAIAALSCGKYFGTVWMDPLMGILGSLLVGAWAISLLRDTARVLLDAEMDAPVVAEIHDVLRAAPFASEIEDLHVWRVGKGKYACMLSLTTEASATPDDFRALLAVHEELTHITVEVNRPGRG